MLPCPFFIIFVIGYGDLVPITLCGKLVGTACAMSGVFTLSLVVPVIATNFEFFYKRDRLNNIVAVDEDKLKNIVAIDDDKQETLNNVVIVSDEGLQ